jgi:hypothetical protein
MTLTTEKPRPATVVTPTPVQRDRIVRVLAVTASVVSVVALAYFYSQGTILAYKDAISHMEIARRVLESPTSNHLAQFGGVWLPLPHILSLPFVWIDGLYYSGLAGSVVSMVAFVVTTVLLYKITYTLTGHKLAGVVTSVIFISNPNVLYMQSTPMTEMLLFACMAGLVYCAQRWIQTDAPKYLFGAGIVGALGTITRYEAWVLLAAVTVVMIIASLVKRFGYIRTEGTILAYLYTGGLGILGWMGWNQLLFNNPLYFQNGEYAKPSLWVGVGERAVGDWWISLQTYYFAMLDNLWLPVVVLMVVGIVIMAVKERLSLKILPTFSLLALFPFFVFALEQGQRPLHVLQLGTDLYNVRFGLLMILPASIFIGYLVSLFNGHKLRAGIAGGLVITLVLLLTLASFVSTSNIATLKEPLDFLKTDHVATLQEPTDALKTGYTITSDETSLYLAAHYNGGRILMESFGNELVLFKAHIGTNENVYEGSYKLWKPALKNPAGSNIKWIIMRHSSQSDQVYKGLYKKPALDQYQLVYQNDTYYVYKERS